MDGDPYLRILDHFLDTMLQSKKERERTVHTLCSFWLLKPRPPPILKAQILKSAV
jgi:hypothetical protein